MSRRGIALAGILAALALLAGAALWEAPRIEHNLTVHAQRALAERGISGVTVRFDGRDAVIAGPGVTNFVIALVADQPGVRHVRVETSGRPAVTVRPQPTPPLATSGSERLPASQVAQRIVEFLGPTGLRFDPGSAELSADRRAVLDQIAGLLVANPTVKLEIDGYTDVPGGESGLALSRRRAAMVADYLTARGVRPAILTVAAYGDARQVGDNGTDAGRAANRRVELTVLGG
jgi:outer membrane protein OmpA-like peptidoglycan-associated protein